jgi:hypothetical protein
MGWGSGNGSEIRKNYPESSGKKSTRSRIRIRNTEENHAKNSITRRSLIYRAYPLMSIHLERQSEKLVK